MNAIKNCPVTMEDIDICQNIFGTDIYKLKGKRVHNKTKAVVSYYIEIPQELKYTKKN